MLLYLNMNVVVDRNKASLIIECYKYMAMDGGIMRQSGMIFAALIFYAGTALAQPYVVESHGTIEHKGDSPLTEQEKRAAMRQVMEAVFQSSLHMVRMELVNHFTDTGKWPDRKFVENLLKRQKQQVSVVLESYQWHGAVLEFRFISPEAGLSKVLKADDEGQLIWVD